MTAGFRVSAAALGLIWPWSEPKLIHLTLCLSFRARRGFLLLGSGAVTSGHAGAKWQQLCWQCAGCLLLLVAGDADAYPQALWAQSLAWTSEPLRPGIPGNLLVLSVYCQWKFLAARAFWEGTEGVPGWPSCTWSWCQGLAELKIYPLLLDSAVVPF